jgi:predicted nucleic acid-binding protein
MLTSLIDSSVVIDILRNYPLAVTWIQVQPEPPGITPIVWMESITGAQNKVAQMDVLRVLSGFSIEYLTHAEMAWAMQQLLAFRLSHNVAVLDCLIASVNYRLQVPLYTQNLKHFTPLLGPLAQKPY